MAKAETTDSRHGVPEGYAVRDGVLYEIEASRTGPETTDCAAIEITLRPAVYSELLVRLDRFVERQDNQADRNWLRQFLKDMRMREMQELH